MIKEGQKLPSFKLKNHKDEEVKFPTKEERENSEWTSCCTGPILK